jgi:hypothetical protein
LNWPTKLGPAKKNFFLQVFPIACYKAFESNLHLPMACHLAKRRQNEAPLG